MRLFIDIISCTSLPASHSYGTFLDSNVVHHMAGYIYIAGSFHNVKRSVCGTSGSWIDNDPHFWTDPPTWGICRPDLRKRMVVGDTVFFVLPKASKYPQMVFAYLRGKEIITHMQAYERLDLISKRMGNKNPNGNIIVDADGAYNRFDAGAHRRNFEKIKNRYVVGDPSHSRFLRAKDIMKHAPEFLSMLTTVMGRVGKRPIDVITRHGISAMDNEVQQLIDWLET